LALVEPCGIESAREGAEDPNSVDWLRAAV
jgi:hypothetical protein